MARSTSDEAAVLEANRGFYRAFSGGDFAAMSGVWAQRAVLACFHPGTPALIGRRPVLDSWKQIMSEPLNFTMRCDQAHAMIFGEIAIVTCYEGNSERPAHLAATNVFVLEDGRWRMVHHHAGPLARPVARRDDTQVN